jgi:hypothetical protein
MTSGYIRYRDGYKYQLCETYKEMIGIIPPSNIITDYIRLTPKGVLTIMKGYAWDGASGPTIDTRSSMRGALIHDALYQLMRLGLLPESYREQADHLLHDICEQDGMWWWRADLWCEVVELFAAGCAKTGTERPILNAP